jgi:16S rRNA (guanine527-N7)-methyltransferase
LLRKFGVPRIKNPLLPRASKPKPISGKAKGVAAPLDGPEALRRFGLSPDTLAKLEIYAALLRKWQRTINLVSASTLDQLWTRHFADSLQVAMAAPQAKFWLDLGSGAGFPGLVTAISLIDMPGARVHLIESDQRKCAFLRDVSRETGAPVDVHNARIESFLPAFDVPIDAVSARALAPLQNLILMSEKILEKGAVGIFPQGQTASGELTDSRLVDRFKVEERQSLVALGSWIAVVRVKSRL